MKVLNIIKKIIFTALGLLLLFELLGIKIDVFAAEASYYSAYFKPYTYENIGNATMDQDISLNADEFIEYSEWISVDSSYSNSSSWFGGISFRVFGGSANTYLADNTYTFRFTLDFYNSTAAQRFKDNFICNSINGNSASSSTGATAEQIDNYSCKIEQGSESNRMLLYLYVKPANDLKYIRVYLRPKQLIPLSNADLSVSTIQLPYRYLELTYVKITYTEGTIAYIENQTATIINQTEMINNTINQRFDDFVNSYNDAADETRKLMEDDTPPTSEESSEFVDNIVGYLPAGPIDSILTLPLTILNNYYDALNGNCQPINVPLPFVDEDLPLECPGVLVSKINGVSDFLSWIGLVASVIMVYSYLLHLYNWTDKVLTLEHFKVPGYYDEP